MIAFLLQRKSVKQLCGDAWRKMAVSSWRMASCQGVAFHHLYCTICQDAIIPYWIGLFINISRIRGVSGSPTLYDACVPHVVLHHLVKSSTAQYVPYVSISLLDWDFSFSQKPACILSIIVYMAYHNCVCLFGFFWFGLFDVYSFITWFSLLAEETTRLRKRLFRASRACYQK